MERCSTVCSTTCWGTEMPTLDTESAGETSSSTSGPLNPGIVAGGDDSLLRLRFDTRDTGTSVCPLKLDAVSERFELTDRGIYVLTFWSTLNRNSNQARPQFVELAREYGDEASFAVVYVNGALEDEDAPYDRLHDPNGTLASRYNVKRVPRTFVIRDGEVSYVLDEFSLRDYSEDYGKFLRQGIEDTVEEQAREDSQTALKDN